VELLPRLKGPPREREDVMAGVVVTGVDGSEAARDAARKAVELAVSSDAELVVVCAYEKLAVDEVDTDGRTYVFTTEESAQQTAKETIRLFQKSHPDLRARPVAAKGKPAAVLLDVAADSSATLIVVGNKRVQGPTRILGSVATDVAHKAPCDVYIANTHPSQR
jgi:nucleotide-binding universal stress UspA family protein